MSHQSSLFKSCKMKRIENMASSKLFVIMLFSFMALFIVSHAKSFSPGTLINLRKDTFKTHNEINISALIV